MRRMRYKITAMLALPLFLTTMAVGGALLTLVLLLIIPVVTLYCMFGTNKQQNESI